MKNLTSVTYNFSTNSCIPSINLDKDLNVKEKVVDDFHDAILRIEVQRVLSIIHDYLDGFVTMHIDQQQDTESESVMNYIS